MSFVNTNRSFAPLILEPLVRAGLRDQPSESAAVNLIESEVAADGSAIESRVSRKLKEHDSAGVFDFEVAGEEVKVRLSQETCRREVYTPLRSSQFLLALKPWERIRVILNGKADWPSGRYYYL